MTQTSERSLCHVARVLLIATMTVVLLLQSSPAGVAKEPSSIQAGAAENLITPAVKGRKAYLDQYVRALVFSDGKQKVAIVTLDLGGLSPVASADELRKIVARASGIPFDNIALNCSHTHNNIWPDGEDWLERQQPSTAKLPILYDQWFADAEEKGAYTRWLYGHIAEAVVRAAKNLAPATLKVGRQPVQIGYNRRLRREDGYVTMAPNPRGAVVPWVDVLQVNAVAGATDSDGGDSDNGAESGNKNAPPGRQVAVLMSHAAHPVIVHATSKDSGPDFPGYAVDHFRRMTLATAKPGIVMFAQGCAGNINGHPLRGGIGAADAAGLSLASAAFRAAGAAKSIGGNSLRIDAQRLSLPLRVPSVKEIQMWRFNQPDQNVFDELLEIAKAAKPRQMPFPLSGFAIGDDLCFVFLAHDIFAEYQLFAVEKSPFEHTFVFGYTNGTGSYVGTKKDYLLVLNGGYETSPLGQSRGSSHRLPPQPSAEAQIHAGILKLFERLRAE